MYFDTCPKTLLCYTLWMSEEKSGNTVVACPHLLKYYLFIYLGFIYLFLNLFLYFHCICSVSNCEIYSFLFLLVILFKLVSFFIYSNTLVKICPNCKFKIIQYGKHSLIIIIFFIFYPIFYSVHYIFKIFKSTWQQ